MDFTEPAGLQVRIFSGLFLCASEIDSVRFGWPDAVERSEHIAADRRY
jgi:hypothetical protein